MTTYEFNRPPQRFIVVSARGDVSKRDSQDSVDALTEYYTRHGIEWAVYTMTELTGRTSE